MSEEQIDTGEQLPAEGAEETETPPVTTEETDAEDAGAEAPEPKPAKGVQKRIDELVKQREDERRRAERLESILEQALAAQKQPEAKPEATAPIPATRPKPTMADFDYDQEAFADALTDWKLEQRDAQAQQQYTQRQEKTKQETFAQTFEEKRVSTLTAGKEKFTDFEEVLNSFAPGVMHLNLAAAVLETSAPADVTYYLGKNPAEAARISKLDPFRMALELGRLESRAIVATPPKKTTSAPPPVNPVGTKATAGVEPDSQKDPEAWAEWERNRVKALGRKY